MSRAKHRLRPFLDDDAELRAVPAVAHAVRVRVRPPLPRPRCLDQETGPIAPIPGVRSRVVLAEPAPCWPQRDPDLPPRCGDLWGMAS